VLLSLPCVLCLWNQEEMASGSMGALLVFCLQWSGDTMRGLGVWRSRSFASSLWFFLYGVSSVSLQDFILGSMLSASSL
jgi:hypothetical protein